LLSQIDNDQERRLSVLSAKSLQGEGIEGNDGLYVRVQKIKEMLKIEVKENEYMLEQSNTNKILLVTHSKLMQAFTAKGVVYNEKGKNTIYGPIDLDGG